MSYTIMATLRAHEFLNVKFGATPDEIKRAYIALMKVYHPDKNPKYADRATWICQMIADARDQSLARSIVRAFPALEHYRPVLDDPGPDLCECGKFRSTDEPICMTCGSMDLSSNPSDDNKKTVWKFVLAWAKAKKASVPGATWSDWDLACKIYNKHFGVRT